MADRPILFSAAMVRVLLAGRKTQTRRVIDFPGIDKVIDFVRVAFDKDTGVPIYEMKDAAGGFATRPAGKHFVEYHYSPRFGVGDRLWVREAHHRTDDSQTSHLVGYDFADGPVTRDDRHSIEGVGDVQFFRHSLGGWGGRSSRNFPGIHMPRWASRLTLTVTDVRVQRLREISEADVRAEGCPLTWDGKPYDPPPPDVDSWQGYGRYSYCLLWNKLNASRGFGWKANPWVVAVSFTVERRNIDQVAP